jgi:oligopeptide/dipeptide ABC transporter ATP-binding protein
VNEPPLLELEQLEKIFPLSRTASEFLTGRPARGIHAVDGVDLAIRSGETVGLIGESGSGKTTLGWVAARLHTPTGGRIRFEGADVTDLAGVPLRRWRRNVQVVFQDPVGSLDPRLRVWQIVAEPLRAQNQMDRQRPDGSAPPSAGGGPGPAAPGPRPPRLSRGELRERVARTLPTVGLPQDCLDQYPHEFSGGGRQRISLARALSVNPKLVILDEPTSALDVAVQSQILNRLVDLQRERHIAYLLITHNVAAVRYVADRVAVMYLGRIVEIGEVRAVLERPVHPYTKALLAAVPVPDARRRRARYRIGGDVPTLIDPPPGCRFAPRCPFVVDRCRVEYPPLRELPTLPGHRVACHRAEDVLDVAPTELLATETGPPPATTAPAA